MLKFLLKIRQMTIRPHTRLWATPPEKHVRLLPPARAVVGHAAHGRWRRHHGNAEVIGHGQASFQLVGHGLNDCHQVTFQR